MVERFTLKRMAFKIAFCGLKHASARFVKNGIKTIGLTAKVVGGVVDRHALRQQREVRYSITVTKLVS